MRLLSRSLGVDRIRWGICRRCWCGCGGGCRSLRSRWGLGVDLVAGGEGTPVVVLGCEGDPQGFGHGVIPAHCGLPHRHGSLHGAHVGGEFLGGELCSPISMQHDPCGEGATGGGGHVECGDDQSACCAARPWRIRALGASAHRARRTGRPSLGRTQGRSNP